MNAFLWVLHVSFCSRAGVQIFHDQFFAEVGAPFEGTLLQCFHEAGDFWVRELDGVGAGPDKMCECCPVHGGGFF